jgi:hypothetical protein
VLALQFAMHGARSGSPASIGPLDLPKGRPDQAHGGARQSGNHPGGIIPLWGARSLGIGGRHHPVKGGRNHPGIGGRLPPESARSPYPTLTNPSQVSGGSPFRSSRTVANPIGSAARSPAGETCLSRFGLILSMT